MSTVSANRGTCRNGIGTSEAGWLFVLPWSLKETGGVNEVLKNLLRNFQAGGVFCPRLLISNEEAECETTALPVGQFHRLNLWPPVDQRHALRSMSSFFVRFPARCWRVMRIVRQFNVAVINPHFPGLEALNFLIMRKLGIFRGKLVLSFHLSDIRGALTTRGLERFLWRVMLRGADHIVVVSDDLGREVLALEQRAARTLRTIYNGVDLKLFSGARGVHESERVDAYDGPVILSVGNFIPRKGHDVMLRAFAQVAQQVPSARLILVGGDGPEFDRIHKMVTSMSLPERVTLLKDIPHERIPEYFSQATLFALASRGESFGLVVTEAAASKVPVVCTRVSGLRELIKDGATGRLVAVDDVQALADAIVELLKNPDDARRLADNFYEEVKAKFTWQNAYEQYVNLARTR